MSFNAIDLSKLPAPDVVEQLDFETILSDMKTSLIDLQPSLKDVLSLESEPLVKLLEVSAYRELLLRQRVNDASRSVMLAYARGNDLDNLAVLFGIERQKIIPDGAEVGEQESDADFRTRVKSVISNYALQVNSARGTELDRISALFNLERNITTEDGQSGETEITYESDERLRQRVQLALEGFSVAGPRGAYISHALNASVKVKDVAVLSPSPGEVEVILLSTDTDGTPTAELMDIVNSALNDESIRPITDHVQIKAANIRPYRIRADIMVFEGPDSNVVLQAAQKSAEKYVEDNHRLGRDITLSALYSALHQPGVERVTLQEPAGDINALERDAMYCPLEDIIITKVEVQEV